MSSTIPFTLLYYKRAGFGSFKNYLNFFPCISAYFISSFFFSLAAFAPSNTDVQNLPCECYINSPLNSCFEKENPLKKNNFSKWKVVNKSVSFIIAQFPWVRIWIKNFVFLQILTQGNCDRNLFRVALCSRYCNK